MGGAAGGKKEEGKASRPAKCTSASTCTFWLCGVPPQRVVQLVCSDNLRVHARDPVVPRLPSFFLLLLGISALASFLVLFISGDAGGPSLAGNDVGPEPIDRLVNCKARVRLVSTAFKFHHHLGEIKVCNAK